MRPSIRRVAAAAFALAAVPAAAQDDAALLSGTWQGTWRCPQGEAALRLELRGNAHGIISGVIHYSPVSSAPEVPPGQYPVLGRRVGPSVVLHPVDADRLSGEHKPLGLQGMLDGGPRRLRGAVDGAGCADFGVEKVADADPAAPLPGGYGAQVWTPVLEHGPARMYVDTRAVPPSYTSTRILWTRWRFHADREDARAGVVRDIQVEYDCPARVSRMLAMVGYDPQGQMDVVDLTPWMSWASIGEEGEPDAVGHARACVETEP